MGLEATWKMGLALESCRATDIRCPPFHPEGRYLKFSMQPNAVEYGQVRNLGTKRADMADNFQYPSTYGRYTLHESIGQAVCLQSIWPMSPMLNIFVLWSLKLQAKVMERHFILCSRMKHASMPNYNTIRSPKSTISDNCRWVFIAMEYIPGVDLRVLQRELAKQAKGIPSASLWEYSQMYVKPFTMPGKTEFSTVRWISFRM